MKQHIAEICFFAFMCGLWAGIGIYDGGWLPWLCAAIHGAVATAGIAMSPTILKAVEATNAGKE